MSRNKLPYNIPHALPCIIPILLLELRTLVILPNEATKVPPNESPKPIIASLAKSKVLMSCQNRAIIPTRPKVAPIRIRGAIGLPKNIRVLIMFIINNVENAIEVMAEVK